MIPPPPWMASYLMVALITTLAYFILFFAYVGAMLAIAALESRSRRRETQAVDPDELHGSRYTIPVSIVAPAFNEEAMVVHAVRSLLRQDYPDFEVILVDDGSSDETLATLIKEFEMEPRQVFYRRTLQCAPLRAIYRSRSETRLTVLSKENGGKADAMNCGINLARYRYLCCVDGDTMFEPDALSRAMTVASRDAAHVVAVASFFGVSRQPEVRYESPNAQPTLNRHLLSDFQHLDLMRSFVAYRMAWSRLNCMLCVPGGFGLWRRDVILEMGGFSSNFTCEDIEMTFRIHERFRREKRPYRIVSLPDLIAQTEGPETIRGLISQRARWQRVTLETVWYYRRMLGRPRYGTVGLIGFPYYALFECLAPIVQILAILSLLAAIVFGFIEWQGYLALLGIMIFLMAIPTTIAVWMHDASFRQYRPRDILRMIALGPLDFLLYRPILLYAGIRGTWEFLRGQKGWNPLVRNARTSIGG